MMDRTTPPPVRGLEQLEIQRPDTRKLPNGAELHVLNAGESEVVRIDLLFGGGRWHQEQPLQALFTNRMLREGTGRYTSSQIAEKLDYYGAWLELSSSSEFAIISLYSLNKYLPRTLEILESMVKEPLFPEEELKVVVANNLQQFRVNCSKVDFRSHRAFLNALYGDAHPCGRLVDEQDYLNLTPDVLRRFYRAHYHSGNLTLYISGRVEEGILEQVERAFGAAPFGDVSSVGPLPDYPLPSAASSRAVWVEMDSPHQNSVRKGCLTIPRRHPDYLGLQVLVTLLGGYFGSRLMTNIREDKGYTYGITANIIPYPDSGMLVMHTETACEYVRPLLEEVGREILRLREEPVPEAELAIVKNYMLGEMCRSYESPFSLADAWISVQTNRLPAAYHEEALQTVRNITSAGLQELALKYLDLEKMTEVVAGRK